MGKELTMEKRIAFLESLELATPDLVKIPTPPNESEDASACVDAGSLITFSGGISEQDQADVKNSCLLAQLAADKKFDREEQTEQWYKFYAKVLEYAGWVVRSFRFEKLSSEHADFEASAIMLEILGAICTEDEMLAVKATVHALRQLANDDYRIRIFESCSHSQQMGNFQHSSCSLKDGSVTMNLGACYFSTTQHISRLLFTKFSFSDIKAYQGAQTVELNMDVYNQVRQQIIDKLGNRSHDFIGDLDI